MAIQNRTERLNAIRKKLDEQNDAQTERESKPGFFNPTTQWACNGSCNSSCRGSNIDDAPSNAL